MNSFISIFKKAVSAKTYTTLIMAMVACIGILYWLVRTSLYNTGDVMPQDEVAKYMLKGKKNFCFYHQVITGSGEYIFKVALLEYMKEDPDVIVLGSSRVLKIYQAMFSKTFLNMGRVVSAVTHMRHIFQDIENLNRLPPAIVIGVDFWWFYEDKRKFKKIRIDASNLWMLKRAAKKIYANLDNWKYISYIARRPSCNFGIEAKRMNIGFLPDGSFMYPYPFYDVRYTDENFKDTRMSVKKKKGFFRLPAQGPSRRKMDMFISIIKGLEEKGVYVVLYIPPVAPAIHELMKKEGHNDFVRIIYEYFKENGVRIYNFHDPSTIGSGDCEFNDGFHPGDVTNARLLKKLADHEPRLKALLDMHFINKMIEYYTGNASALYSTIFQVQERDFIKIGCKKRPPAPKWWRQKNEYNLLRPLGERAD